MQKVLIAGAQGLVGLEFAAFFNVHGYEVVGYDKPSLDIVDEDAILTVLERERPDIVINAAGVKTKVCEEDPELAWKVNVEGPANIARALKKLGRPATLVHISSGHVFGNDKESFLESDTPKPVSAYGRIKLASEEKVTAEVEGSPVRPLLVRTTWLYGFTKPMFIDVLVDSLKQKKPITVANDQYETPVFAGDLAQAVGDIINHSESPSGIFHVVPEMGERMSRFDVALLVAEALGLDATLVEGQSMDEIFKGSHPKSPVLVNTRVNVFTMPDWKGALLRYLKKKHA